METASAADLAYETLRRAILEKAIAPGTRLPEDELAAQFGVSRTPIRAVLARLQNEGLVSAGARRTAAVAEPGLAEARKVFEVRRVLEREAVRLAAQRWTTAHERRLEQIVRRRSRPARRATRAPRSGWPATSTWRWARWRTTSCWGATSRRPCRAAR